ncbi:BTB/POZ domain-containing protein 3-like [Sitodiplosis mosellana]|uniref:BTB/POZ domain-containing protein 3-like n=1 Tax=Sitodiplosis mosellana TaxID=263140 RepID=UPI002443C4C0|nr:BTB/POZ domain-containing protein 3-like [Sitodiplosis mosellana]
MTSELDNSSVSERIAKLYLNSDLADIRFEFDNYGKTEFVPAHKFVLAIASPVFRAWFFGYGEENDLVTKVGKSVKIVDASAEAFKEFLQFFYLPKVTLTMEHIEEVALLADKYDMLDSVDTCATFLIGQLQPDNIDWGYQLAITIQHDKLKAFFEEYIKFFAKDFFKSEWFLNCDRIFLENVLQMDDLQCDETDVVDASLAWARHNCKEKGLDENEMENLRKQLGDCFYLIRFFAMDIKTFSPCTEPNIDKKNN